jgi:hypothetical protein
MTFYQNGAVFMKRTAVLLSLLLLLLLPLAAYAQQPTKPPLGPQPTPTLEPIPTLAPVATLESAVDTSPLQLRADVRPMLGMELFSGETAPDHFDAHTIAGGDKLVDVGGDCVAGYTSTASALGLVWVADSGPVEFAFTPEDASDTGAILIWDMLSEQWWCNVDFFNDPTFTFDNMGAGIFFVWLLTPNPELVAGELQVNAAE